MTVIITFKESFDIIGLVNNMKIDEFAITDELIKHQNHLNILCRYF